VALVALLVLIRWFHAIASAAWVGGMLFYVLVVSPAVAGLPQAAQRPAILAGLARHFREVTQASVAIVLLTGGVLTVDRLSQPHLQRAYVVVLAAKIALALVMVGLSTGLGRRRSSPGAARARWLTVPYLIMALGLLVYLLAILLQVLFDTSYGAVS